MTTVEEVLKEQLDRMKNEEEIRRKDYLEEFDQNRKVALLATLALLIFAAGLFAGLFTGYNLGLRDGLDICTLFGGI